MNAPSPVPHEAALRHLANQPAPREGSKARPGVVSMSINTLALARSYVDASGTTEMILRWLDEDRDTTKHPGGAKWKLPVKAILVANLAYASAFQRSAYTVLHEYLTRDGLTREEREYLGFPTSDDAVTDARLDEVRMSATYSTFCKTMSRIAATFDPRVFPSREGLTDAEIKAIEDERDPDDMWKRQQRSEELAAAYLTTSHYMLPEEVQRAYSGDISLDATVLPIYGAYGHHSIRRTKDGARSPEVNAGPHKKNQEHRDAIEAHGFAPKQSDDCFGFDIHTAISSGTETPSRYPRLCFNLTIDTPAFDPGLNAVAVLRGIVENGIATGDLASDMGYTQGDPERFHLLARSLGYRLVMVYKKNQVGVARALKCGAIMVDGGLYGPCIPEDLLTVTARFLLGEVSTERLQEALKLRKKYELELKSRSKDGLTFTFRCPGHGANRTVDCPKVKERGSRMPSIPPGRTLLPIATLPAETLAVCGNKESVTIPLNEIAKEYQEAQYLGPEWTDRYSRPRNLMESHNGETKSESASDLAASGERRFRGMGKQLFAVLQKYVAENLSAIKAFMHQSVDPAMADHAKSGRKPRRGLWLYADRDYAQRRIAGRRPPRRARKRTPSLVT